MFNIRYAKQISDFNKNVYPAVLNRTEAGVAYFDAPSIVLGAGGGTVTNDPSAVVKFQPAVVQVEFKKMKPISIIYVVDVPFNEAEIASKNPAYFNYLFDAVMSKAMSNYAATVGPVETMRFGSEYVKIANLQEVSSDYIRILFSGNFASNEELV
jgi:hypothetical protein